jgi:hypothetical protein
MDKEVKKTEMGNDQNTSKPPFVSIAIKKANITR